MRPPDYTIKPISRGKYKDTPAPTRLSNGVRISPDRKLLLELQAKVEELERRIKELEDSQGCK